MAKYLQFTISGSYHNSKKEILDFDAVVGKIPMCNEDEGVGSMHVRGRFAAKWVKEAKNEKGDLRFPERIHNMRQVHIDHVTEVEGPEYSFAGKDIKTLTADEMQELAVAKDLRFIPIQNSGLDLRETRVRAYAAYSDKVLKQEVKWQDEKFNFAKLPSVILDSEVREEKGQKITNEEIISGEQKSTSTDDPRNRFSLAELKALADQKGVEYHKTIGFDALYVKLFSAAAA